MAKSKTKTKKTPRKKIKMPRKFGLTLKVLILLLGFLFLWQVFVNLGILFLSIAGGLALLVFLIWFVRIINSGKVTAHMTIYEADSGAYVFATGSMQWAWGLDDFNAPELRKSYLSKEAQVTTKNVLKRFLT